MQCTCEIHSRQVEERTLILASHVRCFERRFLLLVLTWCVVTTDDLQILFPRNFRKTMNQNIFGKKRFYEGSSPVTLKAIVALMVQQLKEPFSTVKVTRELLVFCKFVARKNQNI